MPLPIPPTHTDTWKQLDDLFDQALDLDEVERTSFLQDIQRKHPSLYPKLLRLLHIDQHHQGFLDTSPTPPFVARMVRKALADNALR